MTKNYWQLSYTIHTGRPGRPTKHRGMYSTKLGAQKALTRLVKIEHNKVSNILLTNAAKAY